MWQLFWVQEGGLCDFRRSGTKIEPRYIQWRLKYSWLTGPEHRPLSYTHMHCFHTIIFHSFWSQTFPIKQYVIILDSQFSAASFYCIGHSELFLVHSIPGMIVFWEKQNSESNVMILEHIVVVAKPTGNWHYRCNAEWQGWGEDTDKCVGHACKCNFIYTYKKIVVFPVLIFMTLVNAHWHYFHIPCSTFHLKQVICGKYGCKFIYTPWFLLCQMAQQSHLLTNFCTELLCQITSKSDRSFNYC